MNIKLVSLLTALTLSGTLGVRAQGTAFTYQGRLNEGANPASGVYDLRFTLYDSAGGLNVVGSPLTNSPASVTNGLFTVTLDFGSGVFTGAERWLEVAVRTNGGATFSPLAPRQKLTATPYAIAAGNLTGALSASQLTGTLPSSQLSGTYAGTVTFNNAANVFSGAFSGSGAGLTNVNAMSLGGLGPSDFWKLGGNSGTTPGVNFVGTTDGQPLEFKMTGQRVLRLEPGLAGSISQFSPNIIGGNVSNAVVFGRGCFIGSGGRPATPNRIDYASSFCAIGGGEGNLISTSIDYGTIGGGFSNEVGSTEATVAGGAHNQASGFSSAIGGGGGHSAGGLWSTIAGGRDNMIVPGANYATISGGQINTNAAQWASIGGGDRNRIEINADYSTIGGGYGNHIEAGSDHSVIVGGVGHIGVNSPRSAIVGGEQNLIQEASPDSFVGGGYHNYVFANAESSCIAGGYGHMAKGPFATVPGGAFNEAASYAFAAGRRAKANHTGAFVWADSTDADFLSAAPNQFCIRAGGGVRLDNYTSLYCGSQTRQMVNLFGTAYGVGVQANTLYFRSHNNFNWYKDGVHADGEFDTGGAQVLMRLTPSALFVETADTWVKRLFAEGVSAGSTGSDPQGSFIQMSSTDFARLRLGVAGYPKWDLAAQPSAAPDLRFWNGSANVAWLTYNGDFYARSYNPTSDRNAKERFTPVNPREVLEKVATLPITRWNFKGDAATPHIGPMAQDFHAAFGIGPDDRHIATVDADGVALAAIQGLNQKLEEQRAENAELKKRLARLESLLTQQTGGGE